MLLTMKFIVLFLCLSLSQVFGRAYSQQVTLRMENATFQEVARELSKKEKKFLADLRKELELPNPQAYRMVTELFGCMLDISQIKQEQLYIQGIKDGIRIRKLVKEIEEGEEC